MLVHHEQALVLTAMVDGRADHDELAQLRGRPGLAFDRAFLEGMIRHHLGAIEMVDEHAGIGGSDPQVEALAGHIRAEQETEILRMQELLDDLPAD